jgi:hypothetical protein
VSNDNNGPFHLYDEHGAEVGSFSDWDEGMAEGGRRMLELTRKRQVGKFELTGNKATHHLSQGNHRRAR